MKTIEIAPDSPLNLRMSAYIHPLSTARDGSAARLERPAVIVCPGGGYAMLSESEGEPVAMALAARGFNAFTLRYSTGARARYPAPVAQLALAVKHIREHAAEWDVGKDKIGVMGFSAGGHLCACLGVMWRRPELLAMAGVTEEEARPDALALMYPCTIADVSAMGDMFSLLTGGGESEAAQLSCERFVDGYTPPAFIAATYEDGVVPVEHSLAFASAMAAADRPFELHIFEKGNHCELSPARAACLGDETLRRNGERCFDMCADWLRNTLGAPAEPPGFPKGEGRAHLGVAR